MKPGPKSKLPAPFKASPPPAPPSFLNPLALADWNRIVPELNVSSLDLALVAAFCMAVAQYQTAQEDIAKTGLFSTTASGYRIQSPAVGIANKSLEQMRRLAKDLGLSTRPPSVDDAD